MSTRKRKQDEELVALPSDESEEEEEYVFPTIVITYPQQRFLSFQLASIELLPTSISSCRRWLPPQGSIRRKNSGLRLLMDHSLMTRRLTIAFANRYEDSDDEAPVDDDDDDEDDDEEDEDAEDEDVDDPEGK